MPLSFDMGGDLLRQIEGQSYSAQKVYQETQTASVSVYTESAAAVEVAAVAVETLQRFAAVNRALASRAVYRRVMDEFVRPLINDGRIATDNVCVAQTIFYDGQCTPEEIARTGPRLNVWSVAYDQVMGLLSTRPTSGEMAQEWVLAVREWVRLGIWALGINPDFMFLAPDYYNEIAFADEFRTQQLNFQGERWPRYQPLEAVKAVWKSWQGAPAERPIYASFAGVATEIVMRSSGQQHPVDLDGPAGTSTLLGSAQPLMGLYMLGGKPNERAEDRQWRNYLELKAQPIGEMDGYQKIRPKEMRDIDKNWTVEQWVVEFFQVYPGIEDLVEAKRNDRTVWVPGPMGLVNWMAAVGESFVELDPTLAWLHATQGYMRNHLMFFLTFRGGEAATAAELAEQARQMQRQTTEELSAASARYASMFLTYIPVIGQIIGKILLIAGGWLQEKVMKRIVFGDGRQGCPQPLYIRTMADPACAADLIATGNTLGQQAERVGATMGWLTQQLYESVGEPTHTPAPKSPWPGRLVFGAVGFAVGALVGLLFRGK